MIGVKQCIAWDGKQLALMDRGSTNESCKVYASQSSRFDELSLPDIDGGPYGKVVLAALSTPNDRRQIEKLLEAKSLPEFIEFYRQAVTIGMIAPDFRFQFMAVIKAPEPPNNFPHYDDIYALSFEISHNTMAIYYSFDYGCLAVGQDAYAAMLLMKDGTPAVHAVTAQGILSTDTPHYRMERYGVSYDAETGEYYYTSFHEAEEQRDKYLPFFRVSVPPKTQKEIDDDD
jgi:hypothetical protein